MNDLDRDALDAQDEGRGVCRWLVWLGVAAGAARKKKPVIKGNS